MNRIEQEKIKGNNRGNIESEHKELEKRVARIVKTLSEIQDECETLSSVYGEKAMELIADYPLYASTSNISCGSAIAIAFMFGDIDEQGKTDELMREYFKTDREHSLEDYEAWVKERK